MASSPRTVGALKQFAEREIVAVEGTIHLLSHGTQTEKGSWHFVEHFNLQGRGVSPSGAKYVLLSRDQFVVNGEFVERTRTVVGNVKFIRGGEDGTVEDDYWVRYLFHLTRNANGEWTARVDRLEFGCR